MHTYCSVQKSKPNAIHAAHSTLLTPHKGSMITDTVVKPKMHNAVTTSQMYLIPTVPIIDAQPEVPAAVKKCNGSSPAGIS